jgi:hypothetical protein
MMMGAPEADVRICNECLYDGMVALSQSDEIDFDGLVEAAKSDNSWSQVNGEDSAALVVAAYSTIDPVVQHWVDDHHLVLNRDWNGEARFWYTSRGKEVFQIYIDPPENGAVRVHAASVDTKDDAELQGEWTVQVDRFESALTAATDLIDSWERRTRTSD